MSEVSFSDWYVTDAPRTLDEIYGQDVIVNYIRAKFKTNAFDKNTMLSGGFGSGKTALAKIIAKYIACKHKDADGNPCNTCPTCMAINNETYDRDVIYLNGEQMSAQEIDNTLDANLSVPAIRDAGRVFIVDETQGLSPAAIQKFLNATQSPRKGFWFIFTAMSKLQGKNPGALQSRCKQWKMKVPSNEDVYKYLGKIAVKKGLTKDASIPKEFWTAGLQFLAENSETSFRKALQLLQQCYDGKIYEIDAIRSTFDIVSYDDAAGVLADISHGKITRKVWSTILGDDYQDKFGLICKIMGDASTYKAFGLKYVDEGERWKWTNPAAIAEGQFFNQLKAAVNKLGERAYIRRGDWQMIMSELVELGEAPAGLNEREIVPIVKRRIIKK
jgi:DNA polymerase III delta prime subunit